MNKFGLEEKYIGFLLEVLNKNIGNNQAKFYIFGSRAKGTYKEYSDIDIAIDFNGEKMPANVLANISFDFENSTLPYEVDVVDLNSISEKFKNLICSTLTELNL